MEYKDGAYALKHQGRYLKLAKEIASWSKDPSTQCGCVAVDPNTGAILSQGYNGFPRDIRDTFVRLNDRETKYKYVIHAEKNCIYNACMNGVSLNGAIFYVYGLPVCSECAKALIQVGARSVYYAHEQNETAAKRWEKSTEFTKELFKEAFVEYKDLTKLLTMEGNI